MAEREVLALMYSTCGSMGSESICEATPRRAFPAVPTPEEAGKVLNGLMGVPWLVATLLHGSLMRLMASLTLGVKDVDFERREVRLRRTKGNRNRVRCCLECWPARCNAPGTGPRTAPEGPGPGRRRGRTARRDGRAGTLPRV